MYASVFTPADLSLLPISFLGIMKGFLQKKDTEPVKEVENSSIWNLWKLSAAGNN
ncbi:MAG: hypothetical protein ICV81_16730 [Flavisolibacter sp.]|nr:hypothetical protein [Flavisolibacter sp.]